MKDRNWFSAVVMAVIIIIIVGVPFMLSGPIPLPPTPETRLNKENLWKEICKYPFQDCVLVWKSAIWESGHDLDSKNAKTRHNLFGMKCHNRVPRCKDGYAVYSNWQHSVEDRFVHEKLYYRWPFYKQYINSHWGVMDGTYVTTINQIKFDQ